MLSCDLSASAALQKLRTANSRSLLVVSDRGVEGVVSAELLEKAQALGHDKTLSDLLDADSFPHLHRDPTIAQALDRMASSRMDLLPVVSRANIRQLEGVVTLQDVLVQYGITTHKPVAQTD